MRIAALPMYDFPGLEVFHEAFWSALASHLRQTLGGELEVPAHLSRDLTHLAAWGHPRLLFAQACEYPLSRQFRDRIQLLATPHYGVPGCDGPRYRSAIIVGREAAVLGLPDPDARLQALEGARCAVNESSSNSGMNLLRAAVARFARSGRFFSSVTVSGSHLNSLQLVARGDCDVAAIDCVSWAHFQHLHPQVTAGVRVAGWTASSPSLPFITSASLTPSQVQALRAAIGAVFDDPSLASVRERLFLTGVDLAPAQDFAAVTQLAQAAAAAGYPTLDGLQD